MCLPGDIKQSLKALTIKLNLLNWQSQCLERLEQDGFALPAQDGITGPHFMRQLSQTTRGQAIICCDVGQHQMWVAQHYAFDHPRKHLTSGGLGAMGFGLPAAIGAQLANPEIPVINIAGDGSFMMNAQELATIGRYRLPTKIIILTTRLWAWCGNSSPYATRALQRDRPLRQSGLLHPGPGLRHSGPVHIRSR